LSTGLVLLIILSAVIHTTWNVAAKRVAGNVGVMWWGQVLSAVLLLPLALAHLTPGLAEPRAVAHMVITGVLQAAYFVLLSGAYRTGDLSMVYPLSRGLGVAGAALIGGLILHEPMAATGIAGIAMICCGGALIGLRGLRVEDPRTALFALGIGLNLAVGNANDKLAVGIIHPVFYMFAMFSIAAVVAAPLAFTTWRPQVVAAWRNHRRSIAIVGPGSAAGYLIILFAFQTGPLGYVVAMRELSVALGATVGFVVLREAFRLRKALGVAAIVAGLVLIKVS
jgi:drug/metabolite transporter (DMT)-like permease